MFFSHSQQRLEPGLAYEADGVVDAALDTANDVTLDADGKLGTPVAGSSADQLVFRNDTGDIVIGAVGVDGDTAFAAEVAPSGAVTFDMSAPKLFIAVLNGQTTGTVVQPENFPLAAEFDADGEFQANLTESDPATYEWEIQQID